MDEVEEFIDFLQEFEGVNDYGEDVDLDEILSSNYNYFKLKKIKKDVIESLIPKIFTHGNFNYAIALAYMADGEREARLLIDLIKSFDMFSHDFGYQGAIRQLYHVSYVLNKIRFDSIPILVDLLANSDVQNKAKITHILADMRDIRAVVPVIESMKYSHSNYDDDNNWQIYIDCLFDIKDERALQPIIDILITMEEHEDWLISGILSLGGYQKTSELFFQLLKHEDPNIRSNVASIIGQIKDEKSIEFLIEAMSDSDSDVRYSVCHALGELVDENKSGYRILQVLKESLKQAVGPLILTLKDADFEVCSSAAYALGKIADERAVEPLIETLRNNYNNSTAQGTEMLESIISALGVFKNKKATTTLVEIVKNCEANTDWLLDLACDALIEIRDEQAVEALLLILEKGPKWKSYDVIRILGKLKDKKSVKPLIDALSDDMQATRYSAAISLGEIGDKRAVKPLIIALQENEIIDVVIESLRQIGDERAVKPLIEILDTVDESLHSKIISTLVIFRSENTIKLLEEAVKQGDSIVTNCIKEVLEEIRRISEDEARQQEMLDYALNEVLF